jgi:hypothetical protein
MLFSRPTRHILAFYADLDGIDSVGPSAFRIFPTQNRRPTFLEKRYFFIFP